MPASDLDRFAKRLGHRFQHPELLEQALTHKSVPSETDGHVQPNNERLEFLGDAVLDLLVSELLMERFPDLDEGGLSKFRASLVNESRLSGIATQLDLGRYLRLGRGEEMTGGRKKPSLLADALEAVVAAVYLDNRSEGSIERTAQVVELLFEEGIPKDSSAFISRDYKSELQELAQKLLGTMCVYELMDEQGPDHEKEFEMAVLINDREYGRGRGASKKEASQAAAQVALTQMQQESRKAV
ncbi:MAG TPA: ribonuclease III [Deltaproteobacteria bacterium]|nr:ribonuclease III [Deltaproteobacteria bacterium]